MLIPELKIIIPKLRRVIYFSDRTKQHFKNKYQIINLMHHEENFGVAAEWNYHAIAHGKGALDGVSAAFKREAMRTSLLSKPNDAILSFEKLVDWAQNNFKSISIMSYNDKDHQTIKRFLKKQFDVAPLVPKILRNQFCFKSVSSQSTKKW